MTPWVLVGAGMFLAVLAVGTHLFVTRRRAPGPHHDQVPAICGYLDENLVMNLYLQGNYEALKQEIERTTRVDTRASLDVQFPGGSGGTGRESEQAMVSRYIKEVGNLKVIGLIVDELERKGGIVYVDLGRNSLDPGKGLDRALQAAPDTNSTRRSARLRDLDTSVFVSVRGTFRVTDTTDTTITLTARYGKPTDEPGQVSVSCRSKYFLGDDLPTSFSRCVGQIHWDPDTQQLVIDPVLAVYR